MEGTIDVNDATLDLPPGKFFLPKASLWFDGEHGPAFDAVAYGITRLGITALRLQGTTLQTTVSFPGLSDSTASEMIRALSMPSSGARKGAIILQSAAWLRQQILLPMPAADWATSRLGSNTPEALGFYGTPWSVGWSLQQAGPSPSQDN